MEEPHIVAFVPGFLTFESPHERSSFGDRFLAGLLAVLRGQVPQTVMDVALVPALPDESLASRQRMLDRELRAIVRRHGRSRIHLVGHGSGGVDCALFARRDELTEQHDRGSRFGSPMQHDLPVDSVTTLSAPLFGTSVVRATPSGATQRGATREQFREVYPLRGSDRPPASPFDTAARLETHDLRYGLLSKLFRDNALTRDLDPEVVGRLMAHDNRRPDIAQFCVATLAPHPGTGADTEADPDRYGRDPFYADLWRWTAEKASRMPSPPQFPSFDLADVITSRVDLVPGLILPQDNDGVVNTARQVDPRATFSGLVIGDHADVIGRHRRHDPLDGSTVDDGLLSSGAAFGEPEFLAVLERVASGIANTILERVWGDAAERSAG